MATLVGVAHRHPDILSGASAFVGTRVPVRSLEKRDQVIAVLDSACETVTADAPAA